MCPPQNMAASSSPVKQVTPKDEQTKKEKRWEEKKKMNDPKKTAENMPVKKIGYGYK